MQEDASQQVGDYRQPNAGFEGQPIMGGGDVHGSPIRALELEKYHR